MRIPNWPSMQSSQRTISSNAPTYVRADQLYRTVRVAAFDFDGTLTQSHTMTPFLISVHGWRRVIGATVRSSVRAHSRDDLKIAAVGRLFKGMTATHCDMLGERYAERLDRVLRPTIVNHLRWHQQRGDTTVIVSASLGLYLRPIARTLGIDGVIAVEFAVDERGVLTGKIEEGVNNRGAEKVLRLRRWMDTEFGSTPVEWWAYGDGSGDKEMLAAADHAIWVRRVTERTHDAP